MTIDPDRLERIAAQWGPTPFTDCMQSNFITSCFWNTIGALLGYTSHYHQNNWSSDRIYLANLYEQILEGHHLYPLYRRAVMNYNWYNSSSPLRVPVQSINFMTRPLTMDRGSYLRSVPPPTTGVHYSRGVPLSVMGSLGVPSPRIDSYLGRGRSLASATPCPSRSITPPRMGSHYAVPPPTIGYAVGQPRGPALSNGLRQRGCFIPSPTTGEHYR